MSNLHIEWDPRKNPANKRKHGVSFEEASVFGNELVLNPGQPEPGDGTPDERRAFWSLLRIPLSIF